MDMMLDLETLGTKPGSVILSIGACTFGTPARRTFHAYLDLDSQVRRGMTIDPDTLMWWLKQSEQARAAQDTPRDQPGNVLPAFADWCTSVSGGAFTIWGHGSNFDLPLIEELYRRYAVKWPWKYNAVRDTRTVFALVGKKMGDFGTPNVLAHDALQDAVYQAAETSACLELIRNGLLTAGVIQHA